MGHVVSNHLSFNFHLFQFPRRFTLNELCSTSKLVSNVLLVQQHVLSCCSTGVPVSTVVVEGASLRLSRLRFALRKPDHLQPIQQHHLNRNTSLGPLLIFCTTDHCRVATTSGSLDAPPSTIQAQDFSERPRVRVISHAPDSIQSEFSLFCRRHPSRRQASSDSMHTATSTGASSVSRRAWRILR